MSPGRLALELLRWSLAWWLLWRIPRPGPAGGSGQAGAARVVVPARNEEANLSRLLPSLVGQAEEVIVVDDGSEDGTAAAARDAGAAVVQVGPRPDGWTGKAWACAAGAHHAAASAAAETAACTRLVFLDADTVVEPGGLERILGEHDRHRGLVSVQPFHVTERPYERLSAYFNVIAMMGVGAFTPLGRRVPPAGAFGPCLVLGRSTYEAAGGHEAVRGEVLDDVALARRVHGAGEPVTLFGGHGSITFRMYPDGLGQLVEGWTKNFAGGAAGTHPATLLLIVAWLSGAITAAWGLLSLPVRPLLAAGAYAAYAVQLGILLRRVGRFGSLTAALFPLPLGFFLAVFVRSAALTYLRREVRWRGRAVPIGRR